MADDLGLRDLGELRRLGAQQVLRNEFREGALVDTWLGQGRGAATLDRALVDRRGAVALHRRLGQLGTRGGELSVAHDATPSATFERPTSAMAVPRTSAKRSMSAFERRSVIATRRPVSCSGKWWRGGKTAP